MRTFTGLWTAFESRLIWLIVDVGSRKYLLQREKERGLSFTTVKFVRALVRISWENGFLRALDKRYRISGGIGKFVALLRCPR